MPSTTCALRAACLALVALACASCQRTDSDVVDANASPAAAPAVAEPATPVPRVAAAPVTPVQTPADLARIVQTMPDADTPTPAIAVGAEITYSCDDGNLVVTYRGPTATLVMPDGSRGVATLSVEASATSGGEVYVGDRIGLQRIGTVVELQAADGPTRRCVEAGGTA